MEIKEKDKETINDQSCCSHQQQITNKEDVETTEIKPEPVDKITLLHQALSEASITRAKLCNQQRLALSDMRKSDQIQTENHLSQSTTSSNETIDDCDEFMKSCSSAIKNHKLFPIIEIMSKKCEVATQNLSEASFTMDDVFQQLTQMTSNGDESLGNSELDVFLINSIIMLRLHLLELEKVAELCNDFKTKYLQTLRKKMTHESMIGYNADSDDDICNSSPEFSEQSKHRIAEQTVAMMPTSKGMLSIPLWHAAIAHPSTMNSGLSGQRIPDFSIPSSSFLIPENVREVIEEDNCDSKRKTQLPTRAVKLLKTWLFLHSSHPYPSEIEKAMLSQETGLQMVQINNWFVNARRRILVHSKETPDMDLIHEPGSKIDCSIISKRIRRM